MEREIYPGQQHKNDYYDFKIGIVVLGNACALCAESSGRHGAECMTDGIEQGHPAQKQKTDLDQGNKEIDLPQGFSCIRYSRLQFIHYRAGNLGFVKLHTTYAKKG